MNIIQYKPSVTIVASEEEWREFGRNMCCEHWEQIDRKVRGTKKAERHSIAITFDYRLLDLFRHLKHTSVPVTNMTGSVVVTEATGIARA